MKIGEKIKRLRIKNSLTQEELANRCELSKGFISQIERDLTSPSIATLVDILQCLGTNLKDFFNEPTDEAIVFGKDDIFVKQDFELNHEIKWLVPNSTKNLMEPIIITLEAGGRSEIDNPHEGEEFGYVFSGSIYIHLGNTKRRVKKDESFYFKPTMIHHISNAGKTKANVLWVSTPPSF
ncbi:MAG TPA: cupin domain-containing protein [Clostridiaceae bacterium]|nr:cupin domain-containing protein [Clostridiaceae bacterium]